MDAGAWGLLALLGLKALLVLGGYLTNGKSFPRPLDRETEALYLRRLQEGDEEARNLLVEHNLRLVAHIVKKFDNTGEDTDDLISIGTIGLIKAVNTFDPDKKIKLATYASRCIENEILMYLRRNNKTRTEVSFDEPLNVDWDGNELLLSDVLGTDGDMIYRNLDEEIDRDLLHKALAKLSERERTIMELRFGLDGGEERTQKDVADLLGISQSYISRLEKRIINRLRKEFSKMI